MKRWIWFGLILVHMAPLWAQTATGGLFLLVPPSPQMNGMGTETAVGLPVDDPYAQFVNPANGVSRTSGVSVLYEGFTTTWLRFLPYAYQVGAFNWHLPESPWAFKMSYHDYIFRYGESSHIDPVTGDTQTYSDGSARAKMGFIAVSYQDAVHTVPISLAAGFGVKHATQQLGRAEDAHASNWWWDWGVLVASEWDIAFPPQQLGLTARLKPSVGYSMTNIGGNITMDDVAQSDPAPRTARLGWGIESAFWWKETVNLLQWRGTRAVEDLLAHSVNPIRYQNGIGDINIWTHLIRGHAGAHVTVAHGQEWRVGGVYAWRRGQYQDLDGKLHVRTRGYGIYPLEVFRLLNHVLHLPGMTLLLQHVDLEYHHAEYRDRPEFGTRPMSIFNGWTVRFTHLEILW